ncbi:diguanylate cyclase [Lysobacter sp. N42]|uniref:GGDEF domain-containing protein n=1 Tax=Lysobacter sp. N42 TaxID=2545719 RepID=UPI001048627C|nr:GGDEF domain-containing protein [Lysobacter sp. N42]TCZ82438.1 GGDEF domain-containing protein [Lysobacter sp. N42]
MSSDRGFRFIPRLHASLDVPAECADAQRGVVRARIVTLAPVLAMLTVGWSMLDFVVLPAGAFATTFIARLLIATGLLLLARHSGRMPVLMLLRLFLWIQALGFGLMQAFVIPPSDTGISVGYELAPFVIATQIALFPVTWAHALRLGTAPVAALVLGHLGTGWPLDAADWRDAWLIALLLGTAAWTSHAQLRLLTNLSSARDDASRDALTGLANRRAANERLELEAARFARSGAPLSVLMLDLDRFKAVNDRWGHAAGDEVLRALAGALRAELRACDLGARFGGEEFLVLLTDTQLDDAMRAAERIRRRIAALEIDAGEALLRVTVSIGVAQLREGEAVDTAIARADAALYRAKSEGRDRCVAATGAAAEAAEPAAT